MVEREITINNQIGLQARAASNFVTRAQHFDSDIYLEKNQVIFNGKSIMSLLSMSLSGGEKVLVRCDGEDEKEAIGAIEKYLNEEIQQF